MAGTAGQIASQLPEQQTSGYNPNTYTPSSGAFGQQSPVGSSTPAGGKGGGGGMSAQTMPSSTYSPYGVGQQMGDTFGYGGYQQPMQFQYQPQPQYQQQSYGNAYAQPYQQRFQQPQYQPQMNYGGQQVQQVGYGSQNPYQQQQYQNPYGSQTPAGGKGGGGAMGGMGGYQQPQQQMGYYQQPMQQSYYQPQQQFNSYMNQGLSSIPQQPIRTAVQYSGLDQGNRQAQFNSMMDAYNAARPQSNDE